MCVMGATFHCMFGAHACSVCGILSTPLFRCNHHIATTAKAAGPPPPVPPQVLDRQEERPSRLHQDQLPHGRALPQPPQPQPTGPPTTEELKELYWPGSPACQELFRQFVLPATARDVDLTQMMSLRYGWDSDHDDPAGPSNWEPNWEGKGYGKGNHGIEIGVAMTLEEDQVKRLPRQVALPYQSFWTDYAIRWGRNDLRSDIPWAISEDEAAEQLPKGVPLPILTTQKEINEWSCNLKPLEFCKFEIPAIGSSVLWKGYKNPNTSTSVEYFHGKIGGSFFAEALGCWYYMVS